MPERVVPRLVQVGLMPACVCQLFDLKHNITSESEIKVWA